MKDTRVSAGELKQAIGKDIDALVHEMAEAMNTARDGRIIRTPQRRFPGIFPSLHRRLMI